MYVDKKKSSMNLCNYVPEKCKITVTLIGGGVHACTPKLYVHMYHKVMINHLFMLTIISTEL